MDQKQEVLKQLSALNQLRSRMKMLTKKEEFRLDIKKIKETFSGELKKAVNDLGLADSAEKRNVV